MDGRHLVLVLTLLLLLVVTLGGRLTEGFSGTDFDMYVINLDRMPDRMRSFMDRLSSTDMTVAPIRLSAVDGRTLSLPELVTPQALAEIERAERVGFRERHYELTRGAVGCALSHRAAWDRLLASDKGMVMVCEDDAKLEPDVFARLRDALARMPSDWDVLLLGYWCVKCRSFDTHKVLDRFFGLHTYLIKREAVGKIRDYAGALIAQQEDSMLSDMAGEGRLAVYGVPDKLAVQTGASSSVQMPLNAKSTDADPWMTLPLVLKLANGG